MSHNDILNEVYQLIDGHVKPYKALAEDNLRIIKHLEYKLEERMKFLTVIELVINLLSTVLSLVQQFVKSNPAEFKEVEDDVTQLIAKLEAKKTAAKVMDAK